MLTSSTLVALSSSTPPGSKDDTSRVRAVVTASSVVECTILSAARQIRAYSPIGPGTSPGAVSQ